MDSSKNQISLTSLLWISGATPIWIYFIWMVGSSTGFGAVSGHGVAAVALIAATAAIFRLLRNFSNGLALSALLAGILLTCAITCIAVVSWRYGLRP